MRVNIFGTGAMSCLFGARLSSVGQVTMTGTWAEAISVFRKRGIVIEDQAGSRTVQVKAEYLDAKIEPAEISIVLVKSWQTARVAALVRGSRLMPGGVAVSLQNGLGNLDVLGPEVCPGSTAEGATLVGPGHVRAGGSGATHIAAPEWVVDVFRSAGFECYRCDPEKAEGLIWGKLTVSCGINALTALLNVPNGELLNRPNAADLMVRAARECAAVAAAKRIQLPFSDPAKQVEDIAAKTATNKSSMLQDMLRGARTECDAINGAIVSEGRRLGVPTPVNEILWQLVQAAVHQKRSSFQQ